jgi:hypothetical protein
MQTEISLQYPPQYPPRDRWNRFFVGVRWLGPDLTFFSRLRSIQAARTVSAMHAWVGDARQSLAASLGSAFSLHCRWPTPFFLPNDAVSVIAGGPSYGVVDDTDLQAAIGEIEESLGVNLGDAFWAQSMTGTLGHLVDKLVAAVPNYSFKGNAVIAGITQSSTRASP